MTAICCRPYGWAVQRTEERAREAGERALRAAGPHGIQQSDGAGRQGGGAAHAEPPVEHRVRHARRHLAAPHQYLQVSRLRNIWHEGLHWKTGLGPNISISGHGILTIVRA